LLISNPNDFYDRIPNEKKKKKKKKKKSK